MRLTALMVVFAMGCAIATAHEDHDEEQVVVPTDVLRFMLGCQRDAFGDPDAGPLPVYHTDIDTESGTTSQKVSLLDKDQLREKLSSTMQSDEVVELIIGQLSAQVHGFASPNNRLRNEAGIFSTTNDTVSTDAGSCTINNNIEVSIPAQEVDSFNDRVQVLIQQNSFLLLEQINTLFTYKLRSLRDDFEDMVKERTKKMNRKLDAALRALGTTAPGTEEEEVEEESEVPLSPVDEGTTESSSSEVESSTDSTPDTEAEEQQSQETTEPSTATGETSGEVEAGGTRVAASRPGVVAGPKGARPGVVAGPKGAHNRVYPYRPSSRPRRPVAVAEKQGPTQTRYASAAVPSVSRPSRPITRFSETRPISERQRRLQLLRRQRKGHTKGHIENTENTEE